MVAGRPSTESGKNIERVNTADHGSHLNGLGANGPDATFGTRIATASSCEYDFISLRGSWSAPVRGPDGRTLARPTQSERRIVEKVGEARRVEGVGSRRVEPQNDDARDDPVAHGETERRDRIAQASGAGAHRLHREVGRRRSGAPNGHPPASQRHE